MRRVSFWAAAAAVAIVVPFLAGCQPTALVKEVQQACANAPDRQACEDAEYERRAAAERAQFNRGRVYP